MEAVAIAGQAVPVLLDLIGELVAAARMKNDQAAIDALEKFAREGAPVLKAALDEARKVRDESKAKIDAAALEEG